MKGLPESRSADFAVGVVGIPNGWSTVRLLSAFQERTRSAQLIDMRELAIDLSTGAARDGDLDLRTLDAVVIKKIGSPYSPHLLDRLEALQFVERQGVAMYTRPGHIKRLLDRLSCTVRLRSAGIPMPPTIITENPRAAVEAIESFGEAILKPLYTSKARGMAVVSAGPDAAAEVERFRSQGHRMMYIQKKLELGGQDLGLAFLGGELLGCYARVGDGISWNTTTHSGGKYAPFDPPPEIVDLAHRAQSIFEMDFTCVDVAETSSGPVVFEVSAFGGFRGLLEACGIDAADRYAQYVLRRLSHQD